MTPVSEAHVHVLEHDPDLAAGLAHDELVAATRAAVARTHLLNAGPWSAPTAAPASASAVGLLVLDGLLMRTLELGDRRSTELLGDGDLLRPWQRDAEDGLVPRTVEWRVLQPTRLALLDARYAAATAQWPELSTALIARAMRRCRSQGLLAAISHVNRVDHRLVLAFWCFAERWGRVRPDGVLIRLPLTHEQLGAMIGARRPSVTTALSSLAGREVLVPRQRGEWLLTPAARRLVDALPEAARGGALAASRLAA